MPKFSSYEVFGGAKKYVDGRGRYYQIAIRQTTVSGAVNWMVAMVDVFKGLTDFYPVDYRPKGTDVPPSRAIIPTFVRDQKTWYGDVIKKIWGL